MNHFFQQVGYAAVPFVIVVAMCWFLSRKKRSSIDEIKELLKILKN